MALNTLVAMEVFHSQYLWNLFELAIRGAKTVWITAISVTLAQFSIAYLQPLQSIFKTEAGPIVDGLLIFAVGVGLFAGVETERQLRLRMRRG